MSGCFETDPWYEEAIVVNSIFEGMLQERGVAVLLVELFVRARSGCCLSAVGVFWWVRTGKSKAMVVKKMRCEAFDVM